jgi:GT2 family glycosyltransferase
VPTGPSTSIIIPVHNGAEMLRRCLAALRQHAPENSEIIVVDDCSNDSSVDVVLQSGFRLVRAEEQGGPAAARNLGAQAAEGDILIFLDADVCVHDDTFDVLLAPFADETVAAVFGSYDANPDAPYLVSRFRNLLHHYVHQTASAEGKTFWTGCGAVRRDLFLQIGGFDSSFRSPAIEDIELGMRLSSSGLRIVLNKRAQVMHLKRWTLVSMCTTDVWRRGVPWTRLILRDRRMPNDLNLKPSQRLSVILTFLMLMLFGIGAWVEPRVMVIPLLTVAAIQVLDMIKPGSRQILARMASGLLVGGSCLWAALQLPSAFALGFAGVLGIWLANAGFYRFLSRSEGRSFALAVFPVHVLFFVTCGLAFCIAAAGHFSSAVWSFRSRPRMTPSAPALTKHEAL